MTQSKTLIQTHLFLKITFTLILFRGTDPIILLFAYLGLSPNRKNESPAIFNGYFELLGSEVSVEYSTNSIAVILSTGFLSILILPDLISIVSPACRQSAKQIVDPKQD